MSTQYKRRYRNRNRNRKRTHRNRRKHTHRRRFFQIGRGKDDIARMLQTKMNTDREAQNIRNQQKTRRLERLDRIRNQIAQTVTRPPETKLDNMLSIACKNPTNCLAVGPYGSIIRTYFDDFEDWNYIDKPNIRTIGVPSANGFVIELPFKKQQFTAYTALKCAASEDADNLVYEYFVGKIITRKYVKMFPCFLETYSLYRFKDEPSYNAVYRAARSRTLAGNDLSTYVDFVTDDTDVYDLFRQACRWNKTATVLIQHFNNFHPLSAMAAGPCRPDIYNILYQVYWPLSHLRGFYTHYDLHSNNVFLYKPFEGNRYVTMRYHTSQSVVEFKTEYIVKIIDYGRNYIKYNTANAGNTADTGDLLEHFICRNGQESSCNTLNGESEGFGYIAGTACLPQSRRRPNPMARAERVDYWITPNISNESHDLRLAKIINDSLGLGMPITYKHDYGTPENTASGLPNAINNITDMFFYLTDNFMNGSNAAVAAALAAKYDATWQESMIMNIYNKKDMEIELIADTRETMEREIAMRPSAPPMPVAPGSVGQLSAIYTPPPQPQSPPPQPRVPTPQQQVPRMNSAAANSAAISSNSSSPKWIMPTQWSP